jgi:predicted phosphodiesterase
MIHELATHRLGLIGDVHGQATRLEEALDFLLAEKDAGRIDAILCTGDVPGKQRAGDTNRCAALLRSANIDIICGNHDFWAIENVSDPLLCFLDETQLSRETIAYFQTFPRTRTYETPRGKALLCHGTGTDFMSGIFPWSTESLPSETVEAAIVEALRAKDIYDNYVFHIAGHTHRRLFRTVGTMTLVNPGSLLGDKEPPGFAILDTRANTITWHDLSAPLLWVD